MEFFRLIQLPCLGGVRQERSRRRCIVAEKPNSILQSISASIEGSVPENAAGWQHRMAANQRCYTPAHEFFTARRSDCAVRKNLRLGVRFRNLQSMSGTPQKRGRGRPPLPVANVRIECM